MHLTLMFLSIHFLLNLLNCSCLMFDGGMLLTLKYTARIKIIFKKNVYGLAGIGAWQQHASWGFGLILKWEQVQR